MTIRGSSSTMRSTQSRGVAYAIQWRGKAQAARGRAVSLAWTADVPRCRSILTSQQDEMIDLGGKARRAGTGSVLRDVLLTYHTTERSHCSMLVRSR